MSIVASVCGHYLGSAPPDHPFDQRDHLQPYCNQCHAALSTYSSLNLVETLGQMQALSIAEEDTMVIDDTSNDSSAMEIEQSCTPSSPSSEASRKSSMDYTPPVQQNNFTRSSADAVIQGLLRRNRRLRKIKRNPDIIAELRRRHRNAIEYIRRRQRRDGNKPTNGLASPTFGMAVALRSVVVGVMEREHQLSGDSSMANAVF